MKHASLLVCLVFQGSLKVPLRGSRATATSDFLKLLWLFKKKDSVGVSFLQLFLLFMRLCRF